MQEIEDEDEYTNKQEKEEIDVTSNHTSKKHVSSINCIKKLHIFITYKFVQICCIITFFLYHSKSYYNLSLAWHSIVYDS